VFVPLGAWPTGIIGFDAVGEVETADSTGSLVPLTAASRTEAATG
jgi:hypothetical protein